MKLGLDDGRVVALDEASGEWVAVATTHEPDLLGLLGGGADATAHARAMLERADRVAARAPSGLPFVPQSLRAFALWESHMIDAARGMIESFASPALRRAARGVERITGRVPPPMRPRANYYRWPQFYMGNHRSILADGATVRWPSFADVLDFELEVGAVIARPVRDCTPSEGLAAIGGFVVMNDWSARDTQWDDTRRGTFGGVVKAKTFAGAMSAVVVTADEILPRWTTLRGDVHVNGDRWCQGSTIAPLHDLGAAVAYAAAGEALLPGDVLSSGTVPGCCGLEARRFPRPGDSVRLEIEGLATLTNVIGPPPPREALS